ncbi:MAG: hypothetical protein F7B17_01895 [Desulfurococcales archaeon]|nr:hypothetical protein [Desulfurococcales archaeon]
MRVCFDGVLMPSIDWVSRIRKAVPGYALASIEGAPSFNDVKLACGPYTSGEGLEAPYLEAPSRFPLKLEKIDPRDVAKGLLEAIDGEDANGFFNPLSWRTLTPVEAETRGCIESEWGPLAPPGLDQLITYEPLRCFTATQPGSQGKLVIGGLAESEGRYTRVGLWRVYKLAGGWTGYESGGSILLVPGSRELEFRLRAAKVKVRLLYLNSFAEPLSSCYFREGLFEATALTLSLGPRRLALASKEPFTLELTRGLMRINAKTPLRLLAGGSDTAFRALAESLVEWKAVEGPRTPLNFYGVSAHAIVVYAGGGEIRFKALTLEGSEGGRVHFNPPGPTDSIEVLGPGGEITEMPGGPRVSVPLPPCFCGYIKVRLRPKAKFKLRARLGRSSI